MRILKWKKNVAVIGIVVLMLGSMRVCAQETQQPATPARSGVADELYPGLDPDAVILMVGEEEVPLRKAFFLVKFQQAIVQNMQKSVYGSLWYSLPLYEGETSFQDNMKESIMELLVRMSLARQNQEEYGVKLSDAQKEEIQKAADAFMASNSQDALDAMMADEETVISILTDYTILSQVLAAATKTTTVEYRNAKTYSYIYGSFSDDYLGSGERDEQESETMIEAFQSIQKTVKAGGDFDVTAAQKGYPTAMHTYFPGDDNDALAQLNAVMDGLEPGEVSEVTYIGDNQGIFLGTVQELDEDSLEEAKRSLLKSEKLRVLRKKFAEWRSEASVEVDSELWEQVTMVKPLAAYIEQTDEE